MTDILTHYPDVTGETSAEMVLLWLEPGNRLDRLDADEAALRSAEHVKLGQSAMYPAIPFGIDSRSTEEK